MTVSKTIHFYNLLFYPCFMNNMKVYSRITTLLDYKKQTKNNKTTKKGLFSSHLRHFSIFHIAILTKRSTFVPIKGPCSSTDRIEVS